MTKREAVEQNAHLKEWDAKGEMDYALPQPWVDAVHEQTGIYPVGYFVWLYDDKQPVFGRPYALVPEGWEILAQFDHKTGSDYCRDEFRK